MDSFFKHLLSTKSRGQYPDTFPRPVLESRCGEVESRCFYHPSVPSVDGRDPGHDPKFAIVAKPLLPSWQKTRLTPFSKRSRDFVRMKSYFPNRAVWEVRRAGAPAVAEGRLARAVKGRFPSVPTPSAKLCGRTGPGAAHTACCGGGSQRILHSWFAAGLPPAESAGEGGAGPVEGQNCSALTP